MNNIIFYTTNCPKCKVLKTKMDKIKLTYEICEDVERMLDLGIQTAPPFKLMILFWILDKQLNG